MVFVYRKWYSAWPESLSCVSRKKSLMEQIARDDTFRCRVRCGENSRFVKSLMNKIVRTRSIGKIIGMFTFWFFRWSIQWPAKYKRVVVTWRINGHLIPPNCTRKKKQWPQCSEWEVRQNWEESVYYSPPICLLYLLTEGIHYHPTTVILSSWGTWTLLGWQLEWVLVSRSSVIQSVCHSCGWLVSSCVL